MLKIMNLAYKVDKDVVSSSDSEIMYKKTSVLFNELEMEFTSDCVEGYEVDTNKNSKLNWQPLVEYYRVLKCGQDSMEHFDYHYQYADFNNQIDIYLKI